MAKYKWEFNDYTIEMIPSGEATTVYTALTTGIGIIEKLELEFTKGSEIPIGTSVYNATVEININGRYCTSSDLVNEIASPFTTSTVSVTGTAPVANWNYTLKHGNTWIIKRNGTIIFIGCETPVEAEWKEVVTIELESIYKIIYQSFRTDYLENYWPECTEDANRQSIGGDSRSNIRELYYSDDHPYYLATTYYCYMDTLSGLSNWISFQMQKMLDKLYDSADNANFEFDLNLNLPILYKQGTAGARGAATTDPYLIMAGVSEGIENKGSGVFLNGGFLYQARYDYKNLYDFWVDYCESSLKSVSFDFTDMTVKSVGFEGGTSHEITKIYDGSLERFYNILETVESVPFEKIKESINKLVANSFEKTRNATSYTLNHTLTNLPVVNKRNFNNTFHGYISGYCMFYKESAGVFTRVHENCKYITGGGDDSDTVLSIPDIARDEVFTDANPATAFEISVRSGIPYISANMLLKSFNGDKQIGINFETDYVPMDRVYYEIDTNRFDLTGNDIFTGYPDKFYPTSVKINVADGFTTCEVEAIAKE